MMPKHPDTLPSYNVNASLKSISPIGTNSTTTDALSDRVAGTSGMRKTRAKSLEARTRALGSRKRSRWSISCRPSDGCRSCGGLEQLQEHLQNSKAPKCIFATCSRFLLSSSRNGPTADLRPVRYQADNMANAPMSEERMKVSCTHALARPFWVFAEHLASLRLGSLRIFSKGRRKTSRNTARDEGQAEGI